MLTVLKDVGVLEYRERISDFLRTFNNEHVFQGDQEGNLRGIVITGEASASGISEMGTSALTAVANDMVELITAIEPGNVVAHGAAVWAQMSHQYPELWWSCPSRIHKYYTQCVDTHFVGENVPMYNKLIGAGIEVRRIDGTA